MILDLCKVTNSYIMPSLTRHRRAKLKLHNHTHIDSSEPKEEKMMRPVLSDPKSSETNSTLRFIHLGQMIAGKFDYNNPCMSTQQKQAFEEFGSLSLEDKKAVLKKNEPTINGF